MLAAAGAGHRTAGTRFLAIVHGRGRARVVGGAWRALTCPRSNDAYPSSRVRHRIAHRDRDCLDSTALLEKSRKRDMIVKNCRLDRRPAPPWRILPVHASCGFSEGFRAPHPTGSEHGVGHRARAAPSCTVATGCGASLSFAQARGRACPPRVRACLLQASLQHDAARHYSGHNSRHGGDVHRRSRRSRPASLRAPPESGFC